MKSLLRRLFTSPSVIKDTSKVLAKAYDESLVCHLWQETGRMYYLPDTLKLTYESELGLVTHEKLSFEDVAAILEELKQANTKAFSQRVIAGQATEIRLSICGITWQTLDDKTRSRAVTDAAVLRTNDPKFLKSQAIFKHADRIADLDPNILSLPNQTNVFSYDQITPEQFLTQISQLNERFYPNKESQLTTTRENYLSPFTEHEQEVIEATMTVQDK